MISPPESVEQLVHAARQCSPAERKALLDRALRHSPEIRQIVEERLVAEEESRRWEEDWTVSNPASGGGRFAATANPESSSRFKEGQTIAARFTVVRYIARGGMGEVYEVEDGFLQGTHVALKTILPHVAGDFGSWRRFESEVLLARRVNHRNLCPIYDIARCEEPAPPFLFLTMKLLRGQTLSKRLRQGPITCEDAVAIAEQMIAGIAALHAANIIHRDIKPNNVMLEHSSSGLCLSIMDFGLARHHEADATLATHSLVAGTPGYMAPEMFHEGPSKATDLFALGVLLHQVFTGESPHFGAISRSVEPSAALDKADVPVGLIHGVKEFLSSEPKRRCIAFEQLQSTLASGRGLAAWSAPAVSMPLPTKLVSRRQFAMGAAAAGFAVGAGVAWKWDAVDDMMHPLPEKRFVALLTWPPQPDAGLKPMLLGVIDAIASELSRAEATDRNLLVIAQRTVSDLLTPRQLNDAREALGANIVLAASGAQRGQQFHLNLGVFTSDSTRALREKAIRVPLNQMETLPGKAVQAAARLLDVGYKPDDQRTRSGTTNPEAYAFFQAAESDMKQPNDNEIDSAIDKYGKAIDADPRYAVAKARLAWAYLRLYALRHKPASLTLACEICASALTNDPDLIEAHLGLAWAYHLTGDLDNANLEMSRALKLDPSDPHTLNYQARLYAASHRPDDADATFNRLLKLRPNYWLAHLEYGVFLASRGNYTEALAQCGKASVAAPKNALALNNVGSVHLQMGNLPQAIDALKTSYDLHPNEAAATNLAAIARIQRRYSDSIAYALTAIGKDSSSAGAQLELGDCYAAAGSHSLAKTAYTKAAQLEDDHLVTEPKDGHGCMLLALCLLKSEQPSKVPAQIAKANSLSADDMESQLYKVRMLEVMNHRDDSLATIKQCISKGATAFQFNSMPDLEALRNDPRYPEIVGPSNSTA